MSRFFRYLKYSFFLPIWWSQLLFPRKKNIWVFGAWYGQRYSDNSKYLFEYANTQGKRVKAIWITKSRAVYDHVNNLGYTCYLAGSPRGIYYCMRAKYVIVSSVKKDVNEFFINGAKTIQLWHGNPMKKIGLDDEYSESGSFLYQFFVKNVFSMAYEFNYDLVVSNAAVFTSKMSSAFNIPKSNILETGCPRNDIFYSTRPADISTEIRKKFKDCKLVYYLPTFRDKGQKQNMLDLEDYCEDKLQEFLRKHNMVFLTKAHFASKSFLNTDAFNDRIYHFPDGNTVDINFLLKDSDILITDYSGAYFDFLLTERPIIFAAFDLEEYILNSRELYFDYEEVVAGPIVKNWKELFFHLKSICNNNEYHDLIKQKNLLYNKFHDANNSKRVISAIIETYNI